MSSYSSVKLGQLVDKNRPITYGIVQPGPNVSPDGIPLIRGKDYSGGKVQTEGLYHVLPEIDRPYSRSKVKQGDILLSIVGYVGLVAVVPKEMDGANITQTTARLSIDTSAACPEFVFHCLNSSSFKKEIKRFEKGSAQPGLNLADVPKFSLPFVDDQKVQKKIAQILDNCDEAIEQTKALIEKYSLVKAGMMLDLFTRGLTPDGNLRPPREVAPDLYKETPIGWIPKDWDFTTLGKAIARIDSGWSPACVEKPPSVGEWGVLKVSSVTRGFYDDQQSKTLPSNLRPKPALEVQNGDVILTRANGVAELVGKTVQVQNTQEKLMLSDKLLRLVPNKQEMTNDFLALVMVSDCIVRQIEKSMSGSSGQKNISQSQIRSFKCSKPLVDEQVLISAMISALEQREASEVKKLSKLRLEKSGLMHDLLTGEVPVMVNDHEAAHV